jgi:hypothetical protein
LIILGVDPGKRTGLALYDSDLRQVLWAANATPEEALDHLRRGGVRIDSPLPTRWSVAVIERMASTGKVNSDILRACEDGGRMYEAARSGLAKGALAIPDAEPEPSWLFRREVCRTMHVAGSNKDGQMIDRLCESHGGDRKTARGTKKNPGPLYGCSADSWQALACAVAWLEIEGR